MLNAPDLYACVKGVPRIMGVKYTESMAELKMEHCGESLQKFMKGNQFLALSPYQKACIAFDLVR